jgi:pimeloyl-ACP methyl ester carboxylesterase
MEQVALGPGGWELLPEAMRCTAVANAPAFVAEQQVSDWADLDLAALSRAAVPIQLTQGDQGPNWFSAIVAEIARSVEHVEVSTIEGAGHAPNLTHVRENVAAVREFAAGGRTDIAAAITRKRRRGKGRPGAADPGLGRIATQSQISTE